MAKLNRELPGTDSIVPIYWHLSRSAVVEWWKTRNSKGMQRAWGVLLERLARSRGMSMPDAAERFGIGKSLLSRYQHAKVCPPLKKLEMWGKSLGLEGKDLEDWMILGHLAHAPEQIERSFLAMLKEIEELRSEVADMRSLVRKLAREDKV